MTREGIKKLTARVEERIAGLGVEIPDLTIIDVTITPDEIAAVEERLPDVSSEGAVTRWHKAEGLAADAAWRKALRGHPEGAPVLYLTRVVTAKSEIASSDAAAGP
jgi:hypothetical protein